MDIQSTPTPPSVVQSTGIPRSNWDLLFPCPDCGTRFSHQEGLADHLVVDHWWDAPPEFARSA